VNEGRSGEALYGWIESRNSAHKAAIFTYSLGALASDIAPKTIACRNNGIWAKIKDGGIQQNFEKVSSDVMF
jgi:hypothetical protein